MVVMGTELAVRVTAMDRSTALWASEAAVRAVEAVEERLSSHRSDSELSVLSGAPVGVWQAISPELATNLHQAAWCHEATSGVFDITVGDAGEVELAGLHARRTGAVSLDSGGFGKGVGLDVGLDAARAAGASSAVLDLGGQVAAFGVPLQVDVAHPVRRWHAVASLPLLEGSVATSGQGEQPGHILDPRTGAAVPAWGSVTVHAPTAAAADCLATGLFVLGPGAALAYSELHDDIDVLVVERSRFGVQLRHSAAAPSPRIAGGRL